MAASLDTPLPTHLHSPKRTLSLTELIVLAASIGRAESLWSHLVQYGTLERRWWTRLYRRADVDVWLLTWLPGHVTELHDHGGAGAAFSVVRGSLDEVRVDPDGGLRTIHRPAGAVATIPVGAIHDVRATVEPAVSVHAYSPPLRRMTFYETAPGGLVRGRTLDTREPEATP